MKQFIVTPAMGKRLIGRALSQSLDLLDAASEHTLAIIAGTTNAYVAQEVLAELGIEEDFDMTGFRRGLVVPTHCKDPGAVTEFPGDVIIRKGEWLKGKTIFDVVDDLDEGDVVVKGANAVNVARSDAAVYIGHPQAGTIGAAIQAIVGRRVRLIVPVGLEKRVTQEISDLVALVNGPNAQGPRMMQLPGDTFTEIDALEVLTRCDAILLAGGGVYGAEGCVWIGVDGEEESLAAAEGLLKKIADEPACRI
ncbi:MAG: hypothetical protein ACOCWV_05095 [Planctomycetota bacterium]